MSDQDRPNRPRPVQARPVVRPSDAASRTDDDRPRPRKRGMSNRTVLVILSAVAGVFVLGCVGLVALGYAVKKADPEGWERAQKQVAADEAERAKEKNRTAVISRPEFNSRVIGRNQKDVLEAVGKPDRTQTLGNSTYWYYTGRTKDPVTGKLDGQVQVVFEGFHVRHVNY